MAKVVFFVTGVAAAAWDHVAALEQAVDIYIYEDRYIDIDIDIHIYMYLYIYTRHIYVDRPIDLYMDR